MTGRRAMAQGGLMQALPMLEPIGEEVPRKLTAREVARRAGCAIRTVHAYDAELRPERPACGCRLYDPDRVEVWITERQAARDAKARAVSPVVKREVLADPLLLIPEVAEAARVPVSTVRHWVATGKLKTLRPGRRVLVRRSELERLLTESER